MIRPRGLRRPLADEMEPDQPELARFEAIISGARDGKTTLSPRDIDALMGSFYAAGLAKHEADPGDAAFWERSSEYYGDLLAGGVHEGRPQFTPDNAILEEAATLLAAQGVIADRATLGIAAERLAEMHWRLGRTLQRRAGGDWGHDANLERFPTASRPCRGSARRRISRHQR